MNKLKIPQFNVLVLREAKDKSPCHNERTTARCRPSMGQLRISRKAKLYLENTMENVPSSVFLKKIRLFVLVFVNLRRKCDLGYCAF